MCARARTPACLIIPSAVDPPVRGAVQARGVNVSAPHGRTTLTPGVWSAWLARVDGDGTIRPTSAIYGRGFACLPRSSRSPSAPAGGRHFERSSLGYEPYDRRLCRLG